MTRRAKSVVAVNRETGIKVRVGVSTAPIIESMSGEILKNLLGSGLSELTVRDKDEILTFTTILPLLMKIKRGT
jgi:hypothetical protein